MRRALLAAALASLALVSQAHAATVDSPGCVVAPAPQAGTLTEVGREQVSARVLDITLRSPAMGGEQHVNVLLPAGYDASRRYPVLYLLHGAFGSYKDYVANGIEPIVGDAQVIVVMPDDGPDGSYSDWYGTLAGVPERAPAWETYHLAELVPYVDATFPTTGRRFVAGISSGGAGAMKYAAAHPGMFAAAGSMSGAVNTNHARPFYPTISEALWLITLLPGYGPDGHCTWGDPYTQEVVWQDNDPTYLAENLRGTALFLTCGDGNGPDGSYDPTESEVWAMNQEFVKALDARRIPHTDHFYAPGTHTWEYWEPELARFMTWLRPRLGTGPARPAAFAVRSARARFAAWDWRFAARRDVREFAYLEGVSRDGLTATGSGALDVTTAPLYKPRRAYLVDGRTTTADDAGRLRFTVDLGPSHQLQQYAFTPEDTAPWTRARVRISRG